MDTQGYTTEIPLRVHQLCIPPSCNASCVPPLLENFDAGFTVRLASETMALEDIMDCDRHVMPGVLVAWKRMDMAQHRADLWRYCVLFMHGGVYLDIKTVPQKMLGAVFHTSVVNFTWFAVVTQCGVADVLNCSDPSQRLGRINNGVIATPPRNPLLQTLIQYAIAHAPPRTYHEYLWHFTLAICTVFDLACRRLASPNLNPPTKIYAKLLPEHRLTAGLHEARGQHLALLEERCYRGTAACARQGRRTDRYGLCCGFYQLGMDQPVMWSRDPDYPAGWLRDCARPSQTALRMPLHREMGNGPPPPSLSPLVASRTIRTDEHLVRMVASGHDKTASRDQPCVGCGVLTSAFLVDRSSNSTQKYIDEAIHAVRLLRQTMRPPLPIALFANPLAQSMVRERYATALWDEHRMLRLAPALREFAPSGYDGDADDGSDPSLHRPSVFAFKLSALLQTEFERTFYMDLDVFVLSTELVFRLLTSSLRVADVVMPGPVPGRHAKLGSVVTAEDGLGVPLLCSCLMAYWNTPKVLAWLHDAAMELMQAKHPRVLRQGDQEYLWLAWVRVHASRGLRVLAMPEEYYCPWKVPRIETSRHSNVTSLRADIRVGQLVHACLSVHEHSASRLVAGLLDSSPPQPVPRPAAVAPVAAADSMIGTIGDHGTEWLGCFDSSASGRATYMRRLYGVDVRVEEHEADVWASLEVLLTYLLVDVNTSCLDSAAHALPMPRSNAYLVRWLERTQVANGRRANLGGSREPAKAAQWPWTEVLHVPQRGVEHLWMYVVRGSGLWFDPGRVLVLSDTFDLAIYLNETHHYNSKVWASKAALLRTATQRLGSEFDSISFRHHIDAGAYPLAAMHELVSLRPFSSTHCPVSSALRRGWPPNHLRSCDCAVDNQFGGPKVC